MIEPLQYGDYYHIYNRGNNSENLFREEANYHYFLALYAKYIPPVANTYAYALLRNHFHLLTRIKTITEQETYWNTLPVAEKILLRGRRARHLTGVAEDVADHPLLAFQPCEPSQAFSNLFNAYTRTINNKYGRTGALFERPFERIQVDNDGYFCALVVYIHRNPQTHGFVDDFRQWPFSSYTAISTRSRTRIERDAVLTWFSGGASFQQAHEQALVAPPQWPLSSTKADENPS